MSKCVSCGSSIPEGQRTCSMCYGDVDHGKDGYYKRWIERDEPRRDPREDEWEDER